MLCGISKFHQLSNASTHYRRWVSRLWVWVRYHLPLPTRLRRVLCGISRHLAGGGSCGIGEGGVQYRHKPPRLCAAHGVEAALHRLTFGGLTGVALSPGQSPVAVAVERNIHTPKQTFMMYCGVTMSVETLCVFFSALAVVHLSHPFPVCTTLKHQVRLV